MVWRQMKALNTLRWGANPHSNTGVIRAKKEAVMRSVAERREALGPPPARAVLPLPKAGTAGSAQAPSHAPFT